MSNKIPNKTESKSIIIECDCGTHLLKAQSEVEYFDDTVSNEEKFSQDYYFAMFHYGADSDKHNLWNRLKLACKYIWTGKIYSDQLSLSPDEARKFANFINETLVETQK